MEDDIPAKRGSPSHGAALYIPSNFSNTTGFAWVAFFRLFASIARVFQESGFPIVLSFARIDGPVAILDSSTPHTDFEFDPFDVSLSSLRRLRNHVRANKVRVVYWTDFPPLHWLYGLLRLWGAERIIVHSHISVADPLPASRETGWRRLAKSLAHRIGWFSADHVITCSGFVRDRLTRKGCYPANRISVIHYGLPEARFSALTREATPPTEGSPLRIFCAARAAKVKGVHVLIEATRLLSARNDLPPFDVEFAGDGPELERLKAEARQCGVEERFRFLGYVEDTSDKLSGADIVVVPSIWGDAFPYAVLEAMAASKPIVASRAGGIPEQIGTADNGLLVPPGDPSALAEALARLLTDATLRKTLASNAGRRARKHFREADYFAAVIRKLTEVVGLDASVGP